MEYTKVGNTGMDVSRICLGGRGFGAEVAYLEEPYLPQRIVGHQ